MDSFALDFQRFIGHDPFKVPEGCGHLRQVGIERCKQDNPCWQEQGTLCTCLQRRQKWEAFWRIVRFDLVAAPPTRLHSLQGRVLYHRPIFTFVCSGPSCDARIETFERHPESAEPLLPYDAGWVIRKRAFFLEQRCPKCITEKRDDTWARRYVVAPTIETASEGQLDTLASALGVERWPGETDVDLRKRVKLWERNAKDYGR